MDNNIFMAPGREYGIKPFWFWNGDMNEKEIEVQIGEMAEKGIGGFFLCARQGLKIPYLSQQWFERVKFATECAAKHGLEVWLYDEYPYPSGMSGGEVTLEHPDAKQNYLIQRFETVEGTTDYCMELPWGKVISAVAAPKDRLSGKFRWSESIDLRKFVGNYQVEEVFQKIGLTKYNDKRYFTYGPKKKLVWHVPEGEFGILVSFEQEIEDFKYYGTYVDPCHEEATETFIRTTHERYEELLGEYFGGIIKGMFSDEVGLLGSIPWSTRLISFFKDHNGYDIRCRLPALFDENYSNAAKIRYDFYEAIHLLFRGAYHEKISKWCDRHRLRYATEVPSVRMATQRYSHIPGGDSAHEKLGRSLEWILDEYIPNLRANPKLVSSLARQLGRKFAMIECFHSVGWSMTLQDAKWMIDRLAAFGVNFYNFHAFYYTTDGLTKHDAPPSQFLQNPYWKHYKKLSDYVGRLSYLLSESVASTEIAVLDPTTSFWTHLGNPFHGFDYGGKSLDEETSLAALKNSWVDVCKLLLLNQIDYDHIDGEILAEAEVSRGKLIKGNAVYSVLILPPITNLETAVWEKIKVFLETGGKVIAIGQIPDEVIDERVDINAEMKAWFGLNKDNLGLNWVKGETEAYFIPFDDALEMSVQARTLLELINKVHKRKFELEFLKGNHKGFLVHPRKIDDGSEMFWISNQEGQIGEILLKIESNSEICFEKLDIETGEIIPLQHELKDGIYQIELFLNTYEAEMIKVSPCVTRKIKPQVGLGKLKDSQLKLDALGDWKVAAERDNVLRIAEFEFTIDETDRGTTENWQEFADGRTWPTVTAKTFIDQCSDFAQNKLFHVKFNQEFGIPMNSQLNYPMIVWYRSQFKVKDIPKVAKLLMDSGAISGKYVIYINGFPVTSEEFVPEFHHDYQNRVCEISKLLHIGINYLAVRVVIEKDWDGVIDPLYIIGSFGVSFDAHGMQVLGIPPRIAMCGSQLKVIHITQANLYLNKE